MKARRNTERKPTFLSDSSTTKERTFTYSFHQIRDRVIAETRRRIQNFPLASEA